MIHITTNTSIQSIDSFDLGQIKSIDYVISSSNQTEITSSDISVVTDGLDCFTLQEGISSLNEIPPKLTSNVVNYQGQVYIQSKSNTDTVFTIDKIETEANNYGEHLKGGSKILGIQGIGIHLANSITVVRQSNNNIVCNPNTFIVANTLGPITTGESLLSNTWLLNNGVMLEISNTQLTVISSGQKRNYIYQEIDVEVGKVYSISGSAYDIRTESQLGSSFIRITNGYLTEEVISNYQVVSSQQNFNKIFKPTTNKVAIKIGYGPRSIKTIVNDLVLKEVVPFYTYDQYQGSFYFKWDSLPLNSKIFQLQGIDDSKIEINIDDFNFIKLYILYKDKSELNLSLGSQLANNIVTFLYTSSNSITMSVNGSNTTSVIINNIENKESMFIHPNLIQFSYSPEIISNTNLIKAASD